MSVVCSPKLAQHATDLADGAPRSERVTQGRQEIRLGYRDPAHVGERGFRRALVPLGAYARGSLPLLELDLRGEPKQLHVLAGVLQEFIHAHDPPRARLDLALVPKRRGLDLGLAE